MGAVLAKFRKPKTTTEILENLEQNIKDIEEYTISTQAKQKRYVGNFLVISIGLYILGFLIFYFAFFPPTWMERATYSIPLLIFPLLIFLLKRLVAWYFQRKLNKNSKELNKLKDEKKKILERVMEKETYKIAIEILNRFADKTNNLKSIGVVTPRSKPIQITTPPMPQQQQQQQQQFLTSNYRQINDGNSNIGLTPTSTMPSRLTSGNINQQITPVSNLLSTSNDETVALRNRNFQLQRKKTPFPIINQQQQSVLEKVVDYLIGDGPQNRFAMICKECYTHNGMALQEEFEYSAFRCVFCNALNPSRKSRPIGPKLPSDSLLSTNVARQTSEITQDSQSSTSTSEKESDPDSDEDNVKNILEKQTNESSNETKNDDNTATVTVPSTVTAEQENINSATITQSSATNETENVTEKSNTEKKND